MESRMVVHLQLFSTPHLREEGRPISTSDEYLLLPLLRGFSGKTALIWDEHGTNIGGTWG